MPPTISMIETEFVDGGVTLTIHYVGGGTPQKVWIGNRWLLPLLSAFRGRLDYLENSGIFKPGP